MCDNFNILGFFKLFLIVSSCQLKVLSAPRQARLTLARPMPYYFINNVEGHPGTYSYGYDVADPSTGNKQFRTEERYPNGTVAGSYGYVDPWGKPHKYRYIADHRGYRVTKYRENIPHYPPSPAVPIQNPEDTSITWTRPKKTENKQNINIIISHEKKTSTNIFLDKKKNFLRPPSFYAED